ncbi:cytochrome-c peroxidase [Silvimonas soli]|uniref:cytochrome-c peroxidase n=1 Tax=Silvimonas soli TaxID=2980100 RepID=UPI0024B38AD0|nr:cytochrome c peroxidase [Silvimonas soli]
MREYFRLALCVLPLIVAACGGGSGNDSSANVTTPTPTPTPTPTSAPSPSSASAPLSLAAQVGDKLFFDATLSGSGKMACATCHDPNYAYGPPNNLAVQLGGSDLLQAGTRAVPSLRYKDNIPPYADLLDNPDGVSVPGPGGGLTWDGRAATLADQTSIPLLSANEMANASPADVVAKVKAAAYAPLFLQAFGANAFADTNAAFANIRAALQAYQLEDVSFHPYSSKFDLWAGNKIGGALSAAELRGLQVFTDAGTGNCASCHYQGAGLNGSSALFTDFSYEGISLPRNMAIPANQDPNYSDMGICGPLRTDHLPTAPGAANAFCGLFKAPTLRNVATRGSFFHNGVIHTLNQVVRFYNTRDTNPEIWYPTVGGTPKATPDANFPTYGLITTQYTGGTVQKYNDLPTAYHVNIDTQMPLDGRAAGSTPPMTEAQMSDLICFLNTLTDGYKPPANAPTSGTCVN